MESEVLSLLCDPETRFALEFEGGNLRNSATGRVYPVRDGIPLFVSAVTGSNLRSQALYDRIAPGYDLISGLTRWITRKPDYRPELLSELEIGEGARVLEVAVGTGTNLRYLADKIDFYGIDISWGMLRQCQQNLESWHRQAHLFQGEAERLPFRVESFDCVFHVGGIHAFTNKARAISEMIWVARPGTKIVIVDAIEKAVNGRSRRSPAAQTGLEISSETIRCPINLVPKEMQEIKVRKIGGGKLYCLSFRKP